MPFADLNVDVLIEIFQQYLFITRNGQATLMLVCSSWKEIVTNTARLWTRITINEASPNWSIQFSISIRMSKDLPLTIILLDNFSEMTILEPYINRINSLVIEFGDFIYTDMMFEIMSWRLEMLGGYRGHVEWRSNGATLYVAPGRLFSFISQSGVVEGTDYSHSFLSGIGGALITDFTLMKGGWVKMSLKTLWERLNLLPNIARLRLASSFMKESSESSLPTLHLLNLQELHLFADVEKTTNNSTLSLILSHIRSKSLRLVRLEGPPEVVADLTSLLDFSASLEEIYIRFTSTSIIPTSVHGAESGKSQWPIKLTVDLTEIQNASLSDTIACLQPLLARIKRLSSCDFITEDHILGDAKETPEILGCPITVSHPDSYRVPTSPQLHLRNMPPPPWAPRRVFQPGT